jgi:hypothetical protein
MKKLLALCIVLSPLVVFFACVMLAFGMAWTLLIVLKTLGAIALVIGGVMAWNWAIEELNK